MTVLSVNTAEYESLLPAITPLNQPFWDGLEIGELRFQRCAEDGLLRYPEAPVCPRCLSPEFSWAATSGRASLWSWTVMHQNYFPAFASGPYVVAFVQLEEGPFMISAVDEPIEALQCGMALAVTFQQVTPTRKIPVFKGVSA
jgi:uncharacterized OB-fold protein